MSKLWHSLLTTVLLWVRPDKEHIMSIFHQLYSGHPDLFQIFYQHSVRSALLWTALCSVSVLPDIPPALYSASFTLDSPMFLQSSVPSTFFLAAIVMFLQRYVPSTLFLAARCSFSRMFRQLYSWQPDVTSILCSVNFISGSQMLLQSSVPSTLFLAARCSLGPLFRQLYSWQPDVPSVLCSVNFISGSQMFLQPYVSSTLFLAARYSLSPVFRQLYSAWTVRCSLSPMSPELDDLN